MSVLKTALDVIAIARRAQITMLAAGLAYFAFTSLVPFALLVVVLVTAIGGDSLAERVFAVTASTLGDELGSAVTTLLFTEKTRLPSTVIGLVVLVWTMLRLFWGFDRAFDAIYDAHEETSLLNSLLNATLVFLTNLLALTFLALIGFLFGLSEGLLSMLSPVVLLVVLAAVFLPIFYVFPRTEVTLVEVLPGTVFAAGVWAVASVGFGVYAGTAANRAYGLAGAVVLVLTWLYVGALALLLGATLNAVIGDHVDPDDTAVTAGYM